MRFNFKNLKPKRIPWKIAHWVALVAALDIYTRNVFMVGQHSGTHNYDVTIMFSEVLNVVLAYAVLYVFWGAVFWVIAWAISTISKVLHQSRVSLKDAHSEL